MQIVSAASDGKHTGEAIATKKLPNAHESSTTEPQSDRKEIR